MENITIGEIIIVLSSFFLVYELLVKVVDIFNKPAKKVSERLDDVEKKLQVQINELKLKKVDSVDHDKLQEEIKLMLRVDQALLEHSITGNHTEQMVDLKDELNKFIISEM